MAKILYISVISVKESFSLNTQKFQLKDHYDVNQRWSDEIMVWFENFQPARTPKNCELKLNKGTLRVQRSHAAVPVSSSFSRRHGAQSKQIIRDRSMRNQWREVDVSYDFTYTVFR